MSEEKKLEKKNETAASEPVKIEKEKKKSGVLPLVAVVLIFLNSQKLDKQVVDLKRQIATLQTGEKEMGQRVLALEDELVVMGIKRRLHKISKSRKNLTELKSVLADNPEVAAKVQALADDLEKEQERLAAEISGSGPRVFKGTRPLQPAGSRPPCFQGRCEPGKCFIAPAGHQPPCLRVTPVPVPVPAAAGHHPELSAPKTGNDKAKPQTGWSKFINMRIFGN